MNRLSRTRLETYLRCQRRFQLRHVLQLPWPSPPEATQQTRWQQQGELFHQFVAQYYLGAPAALLDSSIIPSEVQRWWQTFLRQPPVVSSGSRPLVETTVTMPLAGWQIIGRFDLLLVSTEAVQIFDWKTGRVRDQAELANDWQTRLYMALIWGGFRALGVEQLPAEALEMTYWYARDPHKSVTLRFDQGWQEKNLAEITRLATQISRQMEENQAIWPLTDHLETCARCSYRNYCGRSEAAQLVETPPPDRDEERSEPHLEEGWEEELLMEPGE